MMKNYRCFTITQTGRLLDASIRWPTPVGMISSELLDDFDSLLSWIEDEAPCDNFVLRLGSESSEASRPSADDCRRWEKLIVRLDGLAAVSIAVVDGPCVQFAMQLALACDHRIATMRTIFRVLELKEGYLPGMNVFRLAKYTGIGIARRLVFTGAPLDAVAAKDVGIVDHVCEPASLGAEVNSFCQSLAPVHPVAVQMARRLLGESYSTESSDYSGQYLAAQHRCLGGKQ